MVSKYFTKTFLFLSEICSFTVEPSDGHHLHTTYYHAECEHTSFSYWFAMEADIITRQHYCCKYVTWPKVEEVHQNLIAEYFIMRLTLESASLP
jgi:hypothetical protein